MQPGDLVLERYRVIEQIGSGGHSVVFRGQDERLSRPVCIKIFSGLGGKSGVGRTSYEHFVQEAFALSRLTHPNTLRIYDFGHIGPKDADGMPVQICEYMNGGTLANIVREGGPQSLDETVRVIGAMCAALAEAHALGIVHRDIKPQNILFGTVGGVFLPKLADFGIAKWQDASDEGKAQRAEDTAIVAGQKLAMYSPSWAAPEQLAGQPVSAATDIYSLACVAVYMLSGIAIFADEDVYAGYKKRRTAGEIVRETLASVNPPARVLDALIHALAFDPHERLAKVDTLATELHAATELETAQLVRLPPPPDSDTAPLVRVAPAVPVPVPVPVAPTPVPAPPPRGGPRRLALLDTPQPVGDRRAHFAMAVADQVDIAGPHATRIRITLIPTPAGRVVHVKGLSCFVAPRGGRPSPAVNVDRPCEVALVTPRAQEIAQLHVIYPSPGHGEHVFTLAGELVSVGVDDCADPVLLDFGPGSDAYFVYARGRSVTVSRPGKRG